MNVFRKVLEQAVIDDKMGGAGGAGGAGGQGGQGGAEGQQQGAQGAGGQGQGGQAPTFDMPALRKLIAGGDPDLEKQFERYATPDALGKAHKELRARVSEGFKPEPFPEKGTDEQKAEWRKTHGVAPTAADFIKNVGDGIVIGEADKPVFESFAESALAANLTQQQFNDFAKWYSGLREELVAARAEDDTKHQQEVDDALIQKYGPADYRANNAAMMQLLEANFPESARAALLEARDENGRKILTNPEVRESLFQLARTVNPASTLFSNGTGSLQTVEAELEALNKELKTNYDAFMRDPKKVNRQRELIAVVDRLKAAGR